MADEDGDRWAAWLRDQFDRHRTIERPADLVRASGKKENGRPVIDASTVTQWLRGRRPSFELAGAAADAFGVDRSEALGAAGYSITLEIPARDVPGDVQDAPQGQDELLYRRPEGLSDEEWERVKTESREYIEWQIEKASRER